MGSLFGSKQTTTSSGDPVAMEAFNVMKPALQTAASGSINLYNQVQQNPAYAGQRVAGLNPYQTNAANTLGSFSGGFTPQATNAASQLGFSNIGAGMGFGSNAMDIYGRSSMDPTGLMLAQANQYANNPFVNGVIDAAGRDITRNLFERELPGINRAATGAGGLNSTRAGVEAAIAQRGAADRYADMSSNIRSQFFGKGLDMAQNQWNQNLQNMLAANAGLNQAGQFGLQGLTGAQNIANLGFAQGTEAGGLFQNQSQNELNAQKAAYDEALANQLATLSALQGTAAAGTGYKGGPQTTTTTGSNSLLGTLGGIALGAGSLASGLGSLGWSPFTSAGAGGAGYFGGLRY